MVEIDLMTKYPQSKRNLEERGNEKTEEDRAIARRFDKEFFDGERRHGYGGYNYNPKFWTGVVKDLIDYYKLNEKSKVLDIGCGKGFMLYDLKTAIPNITIRGIDISKYAIENSKEEVRQYLSIGNANNLAEFKDKEFDLVTSILTLHNLKIDECKQSLREIQRIGKNAFITVDAWRNEQEKERMIKWNLTALTLMHTEDWKKLFEGAGYKGDYYWFVP
ncbi:MAG: class I SAM-dependent methyltransferase [Candidatus Nanoarchaeia archaeon]